MSKKIIILSSLDNSLFQAISDYFEGYDIKIDHLTDKDYFEDDSYDLVVLDNYKGTLASELVEKNKVLNMHPSLLPAFQSNNAVEDALFYGVKVSGVTVHYVGENFYDGKILVQYPVLIEETMGLAELEKEIYQLAEILYPPAIKTVLEDTLFSFSMLLSQPKGGSCGSGGCGGCKNRN